MCDLKKNYKKKRQSNHYAREIEDTTEHLLKSRGRDTDRKQRNIKNNTEE